MWVKVYRLVNPEAAIDRIARAARELRREAEREAGAASDRALLRMADRQIVVAYESAELAAMLSGEFLWNQKQRVQLLRETILLPQEAGIHAAVDSGETFSHEGTRSVARHLVAQLIEARLLSLWVPSGHAQGQHAILIDTLHPAWQRAQVAARQITLVRPVQRGSFESPGEATLTHPAGNAWA